MLTPDELDAIRQRWCGPYNDDPPGAVVADLIDEIVRLRDALQGCIELAQLPFNDYDRRAIASIGIAALVA